ncbi:hypothetical protein EDD36DRAFT_417059 [Exophiala viscosa]|uniref:Uncharacterized protein n=1 Tax=Exophiala viscosa TaxID=2486360 RepID=A0AAN6E1Y1_9EURO|nr:hypothetical protein EDD36DRAFT_417059 [Exophiala viscosa]
MPNQPNQSINPTPIEEHINNVSAVNEVQADAVSNASSAPIFDDIEAVDPALFDEEEAPDDSISRTAGPGAKSKAVHSMSSGGFNALKLYDGQIYSGMAIGGSHTWNYDQEDGGEKRKRDGDR